MSLENSNIDEPVILTFLDNLRSKTSASHKNLESLPISKSIVNPKITVEEYALYLSLMHDVVKNLEEDIYPLLSDVIPDLGERKKAQLILNDLNFIKSEKKQNHSPFEATEIKVPFAMGIMYVVEGSTLGGRFIIKNIQESFGFDEENGASYFGGYGNKTGSYWKKFLNALTDFETQNNAEEEIIAGADYAFRAIHKHLSENAAS